MLQEYTAEQLRAHFISLGLGMKKLSFAPKSYNPTQQNRVRISTQSTTNGNVLNRLFEMRFIRLRNVQMVNFRTVLYEAVWDCDEASSTTNEVCIVKNLHQTFGRQAHPAANKWWSKTSKNIDWDNPGEDVHQPLLDLFHYVKVAVSLMHPIAPTGSEKVRRHLNIGPELWSWEHIFKPLSELIDNDHSFIEVPPRTDFY